MNCITRSCVLIAFLVAASEAKSQKRSSQEEPILAAFRNLMEAERFPISLSADASLATSGRQLATASQKVIYYSTNYNLDFYAAKAYCESRGTSIATFDDLEAAYQDGYQRCGCGWAANGVSYLVMQEAKDGCLTSIGVVQCSWQTKWDVFCKYPTPVFLSKDQSGDYKMTLAQARKNCEGKGTSLATFEDLKTAYSLGYEACSCGWADNGLAYVVMQKPTQGCLTSIGVIKCSWQSTWNAFCKVKA
ncbi:hypothetical protein ACJMK2_016645 [Sinanodonta woodiana]|uniref:Link domain-containing protein n=1 Tax=Sinanodonta woodiana TaxID=1069815 RepID=A0ABD3UVC7_SINWO